VLRVAQSRQTDLARSVLGNMVKGLDPDSAVETPRTIAVTSREQSQAGLVAKVAPATGQARGRRIIMWAAGLASGVGFSGWAGVGAVIGAADGC
jgi:hypothetical protein